jgi:hypothetical protein
MKQTPARLASRRTALGAGLAAAAIAVSIAVVPGRVSAVTDCVGGPEKSPAWLLLSDAAKSRICSGQQPVDPGVRPPEAQAYDEPWRVIAKAVAPDASAPSAQASAPAPSAWPRLADDEKTLVLMEEIRTPAPQRQPEMRLTTSETSGLPQVQIAGENFAPPRTILISCARGNRSVPLSSFVSGQRRNVASYDVDENVARMVHDERACRITVAGIAVPLPAELVAAVWSPTASN